MTTGDNGSVKNVLQSLILYRGGLMPHDTKFHVVSNIGWLFYDSLYLGVSRQIFTPASRFG